MRSHNPILDAYTYWIRGIKRTFIPSRTSPLPPSSQTHKAIQMNSGNVKEHEKFPLELFPIHCINKRWRSFGVCFFASILHSTLSVGSGAFLRQPATPLLSLFVLFPLSDPPAFSPLTLPQKTSSREQLVPRFGCFPQTLGAFNGNQWLLIFPCTVFFMCGLTCPQP